MKKVSGKITRRDFIKTVGVSAVGLGAAASCGSLWAQDKPVRPPNIVFLFADQQRNASWPGGGDPQGKTPNLDTLAREGAVFSNCISNHPLCSPYRASLVTGRYQQAHTVANNVGNQGGLPTSEVTIASILKKAGYATGYVGKWHLYPGSHEGKPVPPDHRHGFDWWRVSFNYRHRYATKYYDDDGKVVTLPDYAPKGQMDLAMEFVEKNADKPFCIFVSWHPPHSPYTEAPKHYVDLYPPDKIALRPNVPKEKDAKHIRQSQMGYFSHVSALDAEVGRMMKKLEQLGIADNTILCYSSDHGDMLGSFGMWAKNKPWEESINVPFVIRWPKGIPAGRKLDTLLATVDITPTLLGLAGVAVLPQMQGADLSGILRGGKGEGPQSVFIMGGGNGGSGEETDTQSTAAPDKQAKKAGKKGKSGWEGVRTKRYTYVQGGGGEVPRGGLLYDNEKDPYQMRNLIDDSASAETRKNLHDMLLQWRKRVGERA